VSGAGQGAAGTGVLAGAAAITRAEAVAEALAYEFLKNGNYTASSGPVVRSKSALPRPPRLKRRHGPSSTLHPNSGGWPCNRLASSKGSKIRRSISI
jgi:hypothetical protein